jgi:hypothetical protein
LRLLAAAANFSRRLKWSDGVLPCKGNGKQHQHQQEGELRVKAV